MFELYADKNRLTLRERETMTSGSVNVYQVRFRFSEDWEGLSRTACFRAGKEHVSVLLDESGQCAVPWETLWAPGVTLLAGVYGARDGEVVLPTVWAELGTVLAGVKPGSGAQAPTPGPYEQVLGRLEGKQDKLTGRPGQVVGFDGDGKPAAQDFSGGEGGVSHHRQLSGRDEPDQHSIQAITGLEERLSGTISAGDEISIVDIIKIMEG